jgi:hypothetical protein
MEFAGIDLTFIKIISANYLETVRAAKFPSLFASPPLIRYDSKIREVNRERGGRYLTNLPSIPGEN